MTTLQIIGRVSIMSSFLRHSLTGAFDLYHYRYYATDKISLFILQLSKSALEVRKSASHIRIHVDHLILNSTDVITPSEYQMEYEDLVLTTPDRVTLRCYLLRPTTASSSNVHETESVEDQLNTQGFNAPQDTRQDGNGLTQSNIQVWNQG